MDQSQLVYFLVTNCIHHSPQCIGLPGPYSIYLFYVYTLEREGIAYHAYCAECTNEFRIYRQKVTLYVIAYHVGYVHILGEQEMIHLILQNIVML